MWEEAMVAGQRRAREQSVKESLVLVLSGCEDEDGGDDDDTNEECGE
jgi:hypothetical protein